MRNVELFVRRQLDAYLAEGETLLWAQHAERRDSTTQTNRGLLRMAAVLTILCAAAFVLTAVQEGRPEPTGTRANQLSPDAAQVVFLVIGVLSAVGAVVTGAAGLRQAMRADVPIYAVTDRRVLLVYPRRGTERAQNGDEIERVVVSTCAGQPTLQFVMKAGVTSHLDAFTGIADASAVAQIVHEAFAVPVQERAQPFAAAPSAGGLVQRLPNGEIVDLREQQPPHGRDF